jgi:hypothetical protein
VTAWTTDTKLNNTKHTHMPIHNALLLIWILLFLGYGFINPVSDFLDILMIFLLSFVISVVDMVP